MSENSVNNSKIENVEDNFEDPTVKTNYPQIISQYLTFDPVHKLTPDKIIKQTKQETNFDFIDAGNIKSSKDNIQILSNEIPESEFPNFNQTLRKILNGKIKV